MPEEEKTQPVKKKRGKAPYKIEPQIKQERLRWPPGVPRTAPEERIRGEFKLRSGDKTTLQVVSESIRAYFKRVEIHKAYITYSFSTPEQAVDPEHAEPGVAVWFQWQDGRWLKLACDKFNTVVGNLRGCMEVLDGFHKSTRFPWVHHDFKVELAPLEAFGLVRLKQQPKLDTKTHLNPQIDWQQILEIDEWHMDRDTGLPKDRRVPKNRHAYLSHRYHSDKGTDPDNGASFAIIDEAWDYVRECYKKQEEREEQQAAVKAKAAQEAEDRKIAREAKIPKPKAKKAKAKKKVEKKKEPEQQASAAEDEDQSQQTEAEPTAEELRTVEYDQRDDDLDDSDAVDDPNEEGFPEEKPPADDSLFDDPAAEDDTEEELRDELKERRRRMREQSAKDDESQAS